MTVPSESHSDGGFNSQALLKFGLELDAYICYRIPELVPRADNNKMERLAENTEFNHSAAKRTL